MSRPPKPQDVESPGEPEALRSALGAIDNAAAAPAVDVGTSSNEGPIAGATAGVGATELARRELVADDVAAIVRAQIDERHEQACERGMAKVKSRPKLFRAKTFAFGQNGSDDMEDSPTAQGKGASVRGGLAARSQTYQVSPQVADNIGSSFARRMASY